MAVRPRLILVSPDSCGGPDVARLVALLPGIAAEVHAVVLRWKTVPARQQVAAARRISAISPRPALLISDRFDIARVTGLEGVQLPESGASPADLRAEWPAAMIGISRHDEDGVRVRGQGADFALVGPVFATRTKPGVEPLGLERLAQIVRRAPCEVIALGGIDEERVAAVIAAGAAGVAVRGAVFAHADPAARIRALRDALDSAVPPPPDDEFVARPDGGTRSE